MSDPTPPATPPPPHPTGPAPAGGPAPRPEFKLHRSGRPQGGGGLELPRQLKRMLAMAGAFALLGLIYMARYHLGVERPRPLPVLPGVADLVALGMGEDELKALGEKAPRHRGEGRVVGLIGSPEREEWHFCGYPRDFPPNLILGDPPELVGTIRFQDGGVSYLRVVDPGHGPEVPTLDVMEGFLDEVTRRVDQPGSAPLRLADVEARLGFGVRAGRLLEAGAPHPQLDLWRWSYKWVEGGKLGELVDLDLLVAPDGRVVRLGAK